MIGYGENVGSGFPTIISAWKEAQWGVPELKNKIEVDEVELVLPIPVGGSNDRVNEKNLSEVSGTSVETIKRDLAAMQAAGIIRQVGSDKTRHWGVIDNIQ